MDWASANAVAIDSKSAVRSCTTCSKAKAKCVRPRGHEICERCARLKKECSSREPVMRRRKGVMKTSRAAQLEKLEHKIENLVNALSTSQAQRGYSVDLGQYSPSSQTSERPNHRQSEVLSSLCEGMDESMNGTPVSDPPSASGSIPAFPPQGPVASSSSYQDIGVSMSEAEILVDRYHRLMAPNFSFVKLQAQTAQQLYTDRPVLLHAIVTVAYFHDFPRQQIMVKQFMRNVSERALIDGEKSLDLLQGILVLIAWFHPHVFTIPQVTNLVHMAQAMCIDLTLDRAPQSCPGFKPGPMKPEHQKHPGRQQATMDEHRAFAGTFFLTSMLSSSFKRVTAMRRTKYLDEILATLERTRECDSDLALVQMVRLQFLADDASATEETNAPTPAYVKAFQADLERLHKNDPCKHMNDVFLQMHYLAVEILVWELSLNELLDDNTKPLRPHLDNLCNCVKAIKAFVDVFFTIPASSYLGLPFAFFGQFAHAFIALIKLASLEIEGWEMKDLHDQLNFSQVIDQVATMYENGSKAGPDGLVVNNESFMRWATRVRWMKQVYESKFLPPDSEATESRNEVANASWSRQSTNPANAGNGYNDQLAPALQQPTPPDDMLSGDFFNYLDDNFWQSFAGDGLDLGLAGIPMA